MFPPVSWLVSSCLLVLALAVAGGAVPLVLSRTDRLQHLLIAFATGTFLGVVFLHLLPSVAAAAEERHDAGTWGFVLVGVVGLFLLENIAFRRRAERVGHAHHAPHAHRDHGHAPGDDPDDHRRHRTVGYATLFGLSVHAFTSGIGLAAAVEVEELRAPLLVSVLSHKAVEGFSLSTVFLLAGSTARRAFRLTALFSLATPAGALLGALVVERLDARGLDALTALATGTFLFVALCDLLPEVFHRTEDTGWKVALLAAGTALGLLGHAAGG